MLNKFSNQLALNVTPARLFAGSAAEAGSPGSKVVGVAVWAHPVAGLEVGGLASLQISNFCEPHGSTTSRTYSKNFKTLRQMPDQSIP